MHVVEIKNQKGHKVILQDEINDTIIISHKKIIQCFFSFFLLRFRRVRDREGIVEAAAQILSIRRDSSPYGSRSLGTIVLISTEGV